MKDSKKSESNDLSSKKLDSESLEKVSGGFVHRNRNNAVYQWEVIDDNNGSVLGTYKSKDQAKSRANELSGSKYKGQSSDTISDKKLERLRKYR